jgi:hypothetical protein
MKTVDHPNKCPLCLLEPRDGARLVPNDMVTSLFIQVAYGVSPYVFRVELPWSKPLRYRCDGLSPTPYCTSVGDIADDHNHLEKTFNDLVSSW